MNKPTAHILLVDDNEDDRELTVEGFRRSTPNIGLDSVENGEECLAFLRKEGAYRDKPTPDIILLDLNMPVMDGRETLAEIVKDEGLNSLPVVVLTTSDNQADIHAMYKLRCSSYIVKPVDFREFTAAIKEFTDYWFGLASTP